MQGVYLRKYGVETTIDFQLYSTLGTELKTDAVHAAGDSKVMKDEGAEANTTNGFVDEGQGYSITLTATEMEAARIIVYIVDQTSPKAWIDSAIVIETYGHASAMHAMDLDDAVRGGLTALPNANADAAGGLAISDAGGLDLDAILEDTNEIQGKLPTNKFMGSSDGADDDGTLSTIATDVAGLDGAAMRGTDGANTDKTGYKLAADGLDSVSTTEPASVAANFREMLVQTWRRAFKKTVITKVTGTTGTLETHKDNDSVCTTQTVEETGGVQTVGDSE